MTALAPPESLPATSAAGLDSALLLLAVRLIRRGAVIVILVAAGMSAVVVQQYRGLTTDGFDVHSMQALAENPAIRIMFGPPVALDDPGGFTVWRTGTPLAVLVAVWAALTAVRVTRGEEQTGHWNLLLAGRCRLGSLVRLQLATVVGASLVVGAAVAVAMIIAGAHVVGSVLFGAALALIGTGAAAWGGLAGQLFDNRQQAAVMSTAGIGGGLLTRMVADSTDRLGGMHWLTPFGLLGLAAPFSADRLAPLGVLLLAGLLLVLAVQITSRRRDVGVGCLTVDHRARAHLASLRSLPRFTARRHLRPSLAWATGLWTYFLVIGLLVSSVTTFLADNPLFAERAAQAGFGSLTTAKGFLASLFALLAIPLGLYAATCVSADRADETSRHLTVVFASPVRRRQWSLVQLGTVLAGTVWLALGTGVAAWLGAVSVGADVSLGAVLAGALNVLPVAWLSLGAATLAFGWRPDATLVIGAVPVAGGFLLEVIGESLSWPDGVLRISPFRHLAAVPYEGTDWLGAITMTLTAAALACTGAVGFARRDLRS